MHEVRWLSEDYTGSQYPLCQVEIFFVMHMCGLEMIIISLLLCTVFNHRVFGSKESSLNTVGLGNVNKSVVRIRKG